MRKWLRAVSIVGLVAGLMLAMTAPASATIHEIVASWCASTHEVPSPTGHLHDPPGLTPEALGGTSSADNVAQPLIASGAFDVHEDVNETILLLDPTSDPEDPEFHLTSVEGATILEVNDDAPNVKLTGSGLFFFDPATSVYVEIGTTTGSDFPAFTHCANLVGE